MHPNISSIELRLLKRGGWANILYLNRESAALHATGGQGGDGTQQKGAAAPGARTAGTNNEVRSKFEH